MLIPRSDPTADCHSPCAYDTSTPTDPTHDDLPRSGPYGYMGITIVGILAVLACVLWLYLARQRTKVRKASATKVPASKAPRGSRFGIGKRKSSLSLPLPVASLSRDTEGSMIPLSIDSPKHNSTSDKGKQQPRWVSQSGVRKGLVKEVSGGMVVYTTPSKGTQPARPKPVVPLVPWRDRDRHSRRGSLSSGWQMEHLHGVRYEARVPSEGGQETSNTAP